ncbi:hypothetical protein [Variovorax sp. HJSM1_2]|uniref:hypothetical protein n=1 Tax=Variovorax sp. HJSM1_2 TaxID=3366263 RepID=UPI003BE2E03F
MSKPSHLQDVQHRVPEGYVVNPARAIAALFGQEIKAALTARYRHAEHAQTELAQPAAAAAGATASRRGAGGAVGAPRVRRLRLVTPAVADFRGGLGEPGDA